MAGLTFAKEFSSPQIADDLFHVQHNGVTLMIHALQVLLQENAHVSQSFQNTEGGKEPDFSAGI